MEIKLTPKKREALEKLGMNTVRDILLYYPSRYEVIQPVKPSEEKIDQQVIIEGMISSKVRVSYYGVNKSVINFDVDSGEDIYHITAFNQPWLNKNRLGETLTIIGKYQGKNKIMSTKINKIPLKDQIGIKAVYNLKGLVSDKYFSSLLDQIFDTYKDKIIDFIPEYLKEKYGYLREYDALKYIHKPENEDQLEKALNTLKYEEFLQFNLVMAYRKKENINTDKSFIKEFSQEKLNEFINSLPFKLTDQQQLALNDILQDLRSNKQMARLLQGDVGCGKTIVAFIAMYACSLSGKQACMMAPTEILAKQHHENLNKFFKDFEIEVAVLYAGQNTSERKENLEKISSGKAKLIIGTHSLFQQSVNFNDLGLIVTDEQQRFGVLQRQALLDKGAYCDILLMSATPIPRTLASSLYGDLDVSTITTSPNKAKKIHTILIKENGFFNKINEINKLLEEHNQMYIVCPLVEDNGDTTRNVNDIYKKLKEYFEPKYKVGLLHGQLDSQKKAEIQKRFADGEIDILVCTSIIEVGIDVKRANVMIIYNANRFGLSQLHQLRGRVGRGEKEGYCYLLTDSKDEQALEKLNVLVENTDGFKISYYDLMLRGPGDILGVRQAGLPTFTLANVVNDNQLLQQARIDALEIIANIDKYPLIKTYLENKGDTYQNRV